MDCYFLYSFHSSFLNCPSIDSLISSSSSAECYCFSFVHLFLVMLCATLNRCQEAVCNVEDKCLLILIFRYIRKFELI